MGSKKPQKKDVKKQGSSKGSEGLTSRAVPAVIEDIVGRTGFRGEITQVRCRVLQGDNRGKLIRRNVKGPIRLKDILMLRETEIEARRLRSKVTKGAFT
jgi:small subunit ribosomal protein S28e